MQSHNYSKLFTCNIHRAIRVGPLALKLINTPEFQRMREIRQLGLCSFVYPTAVHTRFEHAIGVYFLAGKVTSKLLLQYPDKLYDLTELGGKTKLTPFIAECIKIAALCHDIGHGPFSHIFDDTLVKNLVITNGQVENKKHEHRSGLITEMLCKRELPGIIDDKHISFIKSLIHPTEKHRGALYQIVSNYLNGIDVDKFDYLMRDTFSIYGASSFNCTRLLEEFIVDENENISYPKHCSGDIYKMFHTRYLMHKEIYTHKTVKNLECMISDIFAKIDPIFKISETIFDMEKFCKLTDNTVLSQIRFWDTLPPHLSVSVKPETNDIIQDAHNLYRRITSWKLYKTVSTHTSTETIDNFDAKEYYRSFVEKICADHQFSKSDFVIIKYTIGMVGKDMPNPFESIYFYDKKEGNRSSLILEQTSISGLFSQFIRETHTHLICKNPMIHAQVEKMFEQFETSI